MNQRVIHKYKLEAHDIQTITIPTDSKVLHIAEQHGEIYAWIDRPCEAGTMTVWQVACFVTGQEFDGSIHGPHRGTVQIGPLVFHFYDWKG
jgi:hypothetical protein